MYAVYLVSFISDTCGVTSEYSAGDGLLMDINIRSHCVELIVLSYTEMD